MGSTVLVDCCSSCVCVLFDAASTRALSVEGIGLLPAGCRIFEWLSRCYIVWCPWACPSCQTLSKCFCLIVVAIAQLEAQGPLLCCPKQVGIAWLPHLEHMARVGDCGSVCEAMVIMLHDLPCFNATSISFVWQSNMALTTMLCRAFSAALPSWKPRL